MKFSRKTIRIIGTAVMFGMLAAPAIAGKKAKTGDQDGTPDRDRARDGSCQDLIQPINDMVILAGKKAKTGDQDGTPDRDRARDGSCKT